MVGADRLVTGTTRLGPPGARRRSAAALASALAFALALVAGAPRLAAQSLEYPVKAAFLYKFGPFIEWPASSFETPTSPFVLCIAGDDPFGPALDQAVAGQHVGRHPVTVRRLARVERDTTGCQVLYAAGSKSQPPAQEIAALQGQPVLTVTDEGHGDGSHGMIHFVLQNSHVRFDIDARAARESGLSISSKLLSLAVNVRQGPEGAP